jgi:biopolymer transport protein ExbD
MNFKSRNAEEDVNINLTPLIDVVFLLLIFFMVSTASQDQSVVPPQKLNLMIDAKGNFFLNSRELTNNKSATLKAALERTMDGNKLPIVIQSDADSPVQSLVTAMDVVGQLGLSQVSIATTRPLE